MKTCPPCTGNCSQGDTCPQRIQPEESLQELREIEDSAIGEILRGAWNGVVRVFCWAVIACVVVLIGRAASWW